MNNDNFREDLWSDWDMIRASSIKPLSTNEMYGSLMKLGVVYWIFALFAFIGSEVIISKVGRSAIFMVSLDDKEGLWFFLIAQAVVCSALYSLKLFFGLAQSFIIFNRTLRPKMKTGDYFYKLIVKFALITYLFYFYILCFFGLITSSILLASIPAMIGAQLFVGFFVKTEAQRLGLPELPKMLSKFMGIEDRPKYNTPRY